MIATNASNSSASLAASLASSRRGSFAGIVTTLGGSERGGVRYGDALVHDVVITGFSYTKLKQRDLKILSGLTDQDLQAVLAAKSPTAWDRPRAKNAQQVPVTLADMKAALAEMIDSAQKSIAGTNTATTDDVYEPLVVDGELVQGARVYTGHADPTKDAAPKGTIYLQGLRVGRKVLAQPQNGWGPDTKSEAKTVAKGLITSEFKLPSRRYVSYKMETANAGAWVLAVGGGAAVAADQAGVTLDPNLVEDVREALLA
jgi:hypothetical protein